MRLYYFTNREYGLLAIRNRRLKVSRLDDLNDPFEFLGWKITDPEGRRRLVAWKRQRNEELGIVCFSKKLSNPLLWGHYADKHKGMALGFEVPNGDLYNEVRYRPDRLPLPTDRDVVGSDVDDLLLTKFSHWRYESEYRSFVHLKDAPREGAVYFEPFSPQLVLAEVIVGYRYEASRADIANALGEELEHVRRFKARPAFGTFKVVRSRNDDIWP